MRKRKNTIKKLKKLAQSRGGKCLSAEYASSELKLQWECKEGHQWAAMAGNIVNLNHWCPVCAGTQKLTIEEMREIALSRAGKCLSTEYVNMQTKLLWQCAEGHRWEATPINVKYSSSWCPVCARNKILLTIEQMQQIARSRGGECLSNEYINNRAKLLWQCAEGHRWKAEPSSAKRGSWCPACAGKKLSLTIEEMQQIARSRGGKCLSNEYINSDTKLLWQCAEGHRWNAPATRVKHKGSWCPECNMISLQQRHWPKDLG